MKKLRDVTQKLANAPKAKLTDHIALLLDRSGSMSSHREDAYRALSQQFDNIRNLQRDETRDTFLSYYTFNQSVEQVVARERYATVPPESHYQPFGSTSMLKAIEHVMADFALLDHGDPQTSFLVVVLTDGEEYPDPSSNHFRWGHVRQQLAGYTERGNWTFVFLGPHGSKRVAVEKLGLAPGNCEEWDATESAEYARMSDALSGSTVSYTTARTRGVRATRSFFTTDLSSVTPAGLLAGGLVDVTDSFRRLKVSNECDLEPFIQVHTNAAYTPGTAYYALTKTEDVNNDRSFLLYDKAAKKLYGSHRSDPNATRRALKLFPSNSGDSISVKPGNHAFYEIYIESRSRNRKLVRGTAVYVKR